MPTTFQNRELVRDEIAALFTSDGSWQTVYNYSADVSDFVGQTPVLFVVSAGSEVEMAGEFNNPTRYRFLISSHVLRKSDGDNWTPANAEDKLDELDLKVRQIIRNNAGSLSNGDLMQLESGMSQVIRVDVKEGITYLTETRAVIVSLVNGAV